MLNPSGMSWPFDPGSTPLNAEKIFFLNEALRKSGTEYTQDGFATFLEWGLRATIKEEEKHYTMLVEPKTGRVNAEWELQIDKRTGQVTETWSAIIAPPPQNAIK